MAGATLVISSKTYSSWSLRGWLLTKFSGLEFDEIVTAPDGWRPQLLKEDVKTHLPS